MLLIFFLNLNPIKKTPLRYAAKTFDFVGLFLLAIGIVLLLLGFQFAQSAAGGWKAPQTMISLIVGVILLVLGFINELDTPREPIIPPKLLQKRTTVAVLITCFLHTFTVFGASYYVPLYFQILGSSATLAGIKQLPISFGSSAVAVVVGIIIDAVRAAFPALSSGFLYADNAGGSQCLADAAARISDYLLDTNVQLGADYGVSVTSTQRVAAGADAARELFNAESVEEVAYGSSSTMLVENLARALEADVQAGEEIVVTGEHECTSPPFLSDYSPR